VLLHLPDDSGAPAPYSRVAEAPFHLPDGRVAPGAFLGAEGINKDGGGEGSLAQGTSPSTGMEWGSGGSEVPFLGAKGGPTC